MNHTLFYLVVHEGHTVEFWEDQILLLKDKRRYSPVVQIFSELRFRANPCNLIWSEHESHDFLAEFELVTLITNFVNQILLFLVMLSA